MASAQTGPTSRTGQADSIANHVAQCLTAFRVLSAATDIDKTRVDGLVARNASLAKMEYQRARFKLWSGNIGAHRTGRSSLDYRLRDSSHLQQQVLRLLRRLEQSVDEAGSSISAGENEDNDELSDDDSALDSEFMRKLRELGSESTLERVATSVCIIIDCLFCLSISIHNPAPHDRFISSKLTDTSHFEHHDISYVRDKFPGAEYYLIERLGKAISRRRQYFKYRQSHREKLSAGLDIEEKRIEEGRIEEGRNEEGWIEEGWIDVQSTIASSIPLALKDSIKTHSSMIVLDEDGHSDAGVSRTSFATTAQDSGRPKIPSIPKQYIDGPFECPLCYMIISVTTTIEWRRHVMTDLKPYNCIERDCIATNAEFTLRHDWLGHVLQYHWKSWHCPLSCTKTFNSPAELQNHFAESHPAAVPPDEISGVLDSSERKRAQATRTECPLCMEKLESLKQYQKHVGRHQVDLALFALPPIEDQDEFDGEDASSLNSAGNLEIVSQTSDDENNNEGDISEDSDSEIISKMALDETELDVLSGASKVQHDQIGPQQASPIISSEASELDIDNPAPTSHAENVDVRSALSPASSSNADRVNKLTTLDNGATTVQDHSTHSRLLQCPFCPMRCFGLRPHLEIHTNQPESACIVCGKIFPNLDDRERHENLHVGEHKFVCKGELKTGSLWGCGTKYDSIHALVQHFHSESGRECIKRLLHQQIGRTGAWIMMPRVLLGQYHWFYQIEEANPETRAVQGDLAYTANIEWVKKSQVQKELDQWDWKLFKRAPEWWGELDEEEQEWWSELYLYEPLGNYPGRGL
ncbi:hypothetical protein GGR57DRAFT_282123 [Xylariaceae sp. FL1272]|nr:hypothetical protein GGR57DRAFT_282123 [Xylariaceae sp. FL1272]